MKKILLISLILLFILTPVSLGLQNNSITIIPLEVLAEGHDEKPEASCGWDVLCGITKGLTSLIENLAAAAIYLSGLLLMISALLLDEVVKILVVDFGTVFGKIDGINTAWSALRDLANIFFIFGLLAIAISTILGLQGYGYKKLLSNLIIIALLINFSLFFTKFVIDASNIFALEFYQGIVAGQGTDASISYPFTKNLGVASLWDTKPLLEKGVSKDLGQILAHATLTSLFFLTTAMVFLFAAIMLVVRSVAFILLAILSPLAFAAMILPKTRGMAQEWWGKLLNFAIFAPILFMLFWVTAKIIPDVVGSIDLRGGGILDIFSDDSDKRGNAISYIMNFVIVITLMLASITISNRLSLDFGEKAAAWAKKPLSIPGVGLAGRGAIGALGGFGRTTLGRGLSRYSESEKLKEKASMGGFRGFAARQRLKAARFGAKASYDVRGVPGAKAATKAAGISLGKAQKGGYEAVLKKQVKSREKFAESLGTEERKKRYTEEVLAKEPVGGVPPKYSKFDLRKIETLWLKVPRKNKDAAAAIRKGKSENEKLIEGLAKELKGSLKSEDKEGKDE